MNRHRRKRILIYALLIPTTSILVLPVLWFLLLSFRPDSVIARGVESITSGQFVVDNYRRLFASFNVHRYLLNSLIASIVPACVSVFIALLAGYALVRFEFRGRGFFYTLPLAAQTVPIIQLVLPFYVFMHALSLLNTYTAVILAHVSLVLPLCVWMMAGYLRSVPREMEEAAMVDGCSRVGALLRIVFPTALPGIAATALVAFLQAWGEFLLAYILTSTENMRLLSVAVYALVPGAQAPSTWGILFAASAVFMAPSLLLFVFLQRAFQQGLAMGAVAGR